MAGPVPEPASLLVRRTVPRILATPGAIEALHKANQQPWEFLARHARGDWGDLDTHDIDAERILRDSSGKFADAQKRRALYVMLARSQPTEEQLLWLTTVVEGFLQ